MRVMPANRDALARIASTELGGVSPAIPPAPARARPGVAAIKSVLRQADRHPLTLTWTKFSGLRHKLQIPGLPVPILSQHVEQL